jgi:archaellum biogenesis protein FlaJ (TadC family)
MKKENKILTGFRLSEGNLKFIEETGEKLGMNKTSVLDMLLTILRKDKGIMTDLIRKALQG